MLKHCGPPRACTATPPATASRPGRRGTHCRPRSPTGTAGGDAGGIGGEGPTRRGGRGGESTDGGRAALARLVGVAAARVGVGATVSELVGSIVTALPAGTRVV